MIGERLHVFFDRRFVQLLYGLNYYFFVKYGQLNGKTGVSKQINASPNRSRNTIFCHLRIG